MAAHEAGLAKYIEGSWPTAVAWLCVATVMFNTARNAYKHLLNYSRPDLQPHVLRIIFVGPLYVLSAALCLSMGRTACFFVSAVRDIWEAVVIYSFLTLIIEYMGGEHLCLHSISQREEAVAHLFPLNWCLPPIPTGALIRVPKILALQFVVIKPVLTAVSIVVYACGQLGNWYYQWSLFVLYNISYSVALYALYLIYWASHEHQALQSKQPLLKFVSVKMIVFLTFWQALLLPHLPLPGSIDRWEDFIIACEMVLFSVLMNAAFSWREFHSGLRASQRSTPVGVPRAKNDLLDLEESGVVVAAGAPHPGPRPVGRHGQVVQNAKAALNPLDIFDAASANFSRRYQQHVLIESAQEYELRSSEEPPNADPPPPSSHGTLDEGAAASRAAAGQTGTLRTFRARTYLIGRSLGLMSDASQEANPHQQNGSCARQQMATGAFGATGASDIGCPRVPADTSSFGKTTCTVKSEEPVAEQGGASAAPVTAATLPAPAG